MSTVYPRTFSNVFGIDKGAPAFTYLWDPNLIVTGGNPAQLLTGGLRIATPADYTADIFVSGISFSIGAVNLTGVNVVTLTGNTPVVVTGFAAGVTVNTNITNSGPIAISGNGANGSVIINSGTYFPTFAFITGGQTQIPAGARSASIAVLSGSATINGTGGFPAGITIKLGGYDGRFILNSAVNVGCTGSLLSPSQVLVIYES